MTDNSTPEVVLKYYEACKEYNRLDKVKTELYAEVYQLLEDYGDFPEVKREYWQSVDFDEVAVYKWLQENYSPDIVKECEKWSLDWDKFNSLVKLGKINFRDIPASCMITRDGYRIKTARAKKNANREDYS